MSDTVEIVRERVIQAAQTWIGTPYHPMARMRHVGVDCLTLLVEVYQEAGMISEVDVPYYPRDWHLHRIEEKYLQGLLRYAHEVESPLKGDVALWQFGRCFSHGAIVVAWPEVIHAHAGSCCIREDAHAATWLQEIAPGKQRPCKFFSLF